MRTDDDPTGLKIPITDFLVDGVLSVGALYGAFLAWWCGYGKSVMAIFHVIKMTLLEVKAYNNQRMVSIGKLLIMRNIVFKSLIYFHEFSQLNA